MKEERGKQIETRCKSAGALETVAGPIPGAGGSHTSVYSPLGARLGKIMAALHGLAHGAHISEPGQVLREEKVEWMLQ